jgi:transposase-like protein
MQVREASVARYLNSNLTMREVADQFGATRYSVADWVRKAGALSDMSKKAKVEPIPTDKRSAEEKLRLLLEASSLADEKLGEFLRREGLHEGDLQRFRTEAIGGLSGQVRSDADRRRIQELERTNTRNEKRLREAEALLDLQKKVHALWGAKEDDTTES